jgi:hypothetical protein
MLEYYQRFIGKKCWLLDSNLNLPKDKEFTVIGVEGKPTDWGTTLPVYVLRNGTETEKCYPGQCVFVPDNSLPEEEKVSRYLSDNEVYPEEVYFPFNDEKELNVTINHGDWKHSHNRADWLMEEIGYIVGNRISCGEETDDDNFSAIHIYYKTA